MKRQLLVIVMGSLFALPAVANNEIDAGNLPADLTPSMTRAQVRAELVAAQRAGDVVVNAELGSTGRIVPHAGKTRAQVLAELIEAQRTGEIVVNAELGTTGKSLRQAGKARDDVYVELTLARNP